MTVGNSIYTSTHLHTPAIVFWTNCTRKPSQNISNFHEVYFVHSMFTVCPDLESSDKCSQCSAYLQCLSTHGTVWGLGGKLPQLQHFTGHASQLPLTWPRVAGGCVITVVTAHSNKPLLLPGTHWLTACWRWQVAARTACSRTLRGPVSPGP